MRAAGLTLPRPPQIHHPHPLSSHPLDRGAYWKAISTAILTAPGPIPHSGLSVGGIHRGRVVGWWVARPVRIPHPLPPGPFKRVHILLKPIKWIRRQMYGRRTLPTRGTRSRIEERGVGGRVGEIHFPVILEQHYFRLVYSPNAHERRSDANLRLGRTHSARTYGKYPLYRSPAFSKRVSIDWLDGFGAPESVLINQIIILGGGNGKLNKQLAVWK